MMRMARMVRLILLRRATLLLTVVAALISVGVAAPSPASARTFVQVHNAAIPDLCISHDSWLAGETLGEGQCVYDQAISWDVPGDGTFHEWLHGVDQRLCLTALPGTNGASVKQEPCGYPDSDPYQQWDVINGGQLRNRATGNCLAVWLPQEENEPLTQWNCANRSPDQFWHW
jgi:hypothetical protein